MLHDHVSFYLDFRLNCDVLFVSYNCNDLSNKTMFYLCMFRLIFISVLFICVYRSGSSGSDMDDSGSDDYEWISIAMVCPIVLYIRSSILERQLVKNLRMCWFVSCP